MILGFIQTTIRLTESTKRIQDQTVIWQKTPFGTTLRHATCPSPMLTSTQTTHGGMEQSRVDMMYKVYSSTKWGIR